MLLCAQPLLDLGAERLIALGPVLDTAGYLDAPELERLERILRKGEEQTGCAIRVLTRNRLSADWTRDTKAVRCAFDVAATRDSVLIVADRGIAGALEAGASFLSFDVAGPNVRLALPPSYWARLVQEYGRQSYVSKRGEAASIVTSCELILTCLRSEEGFCTTVPAASSSYF